MYLTSAVFKTVLKCVKKHRILSLSTLSGLYFFKINKMYLQIQILNLYQQIYFFIEYDLKFKCKFNTYYFFTWDRDVLFMAISWLYSIFVIKSCEK